jgi:hypothetical protein
MPQMLAEPANRFVFLGVAFLLFIMACSATVIYWAIDDEVPIIGMTGTFRGWDKDNPNIGRVEWVGQRNRYCDATVDHWVINDGRYVDFYESHRPGSHIMNEADKGKQDVIYDSFEVPVEVRRNLFKPKYRVRFEFVCNYLQKVFPIVVTPPELSIEPLNANDHSPHGP